MTLTDRGRVVPRLVFLTCVVLGLCVGSAAASGPPRGRIYQQPPEQHPGADAASPGAPASVPEAAEPSPAAAALPNVPPVPDPASNARLPIIQRPDIPIENTPIPGQRSPQTTPPTTKVELKYVPGFRTILTGHRENYFISGTSSAQHTVKFQFSFKFDLWPNATRHSAYFGFTQKSLWSLWNFAGSSPFVESNYSPEIFYGFYSKIGDVDPIPGHMTYFIDYARVGLQHESNGLDGVTSRGWDRVYASARVGAYLGINHYASVTPTAWLPPFDKGDNANISDYLGYGSLGIEYGYDPAIKRWWGGFSVAATGWKGANTVMERNAVELSAQWRPAYEGKFVEWWKFTPFIYAQLHDGYGETLLQYDKRVTAFRIGLAMEDRVNWITLPKSKATDPDLSR